MAIRSDVMFPRIDRCNWANLCFEQNRPTLSYDMWENIASIIHIGLYDSRSERYADQLFRFAKGFSAHRRILVILLIRKAYIVEQLLGETNVATDLARRECTNFFLEHSFKTFCHYLKTFRIKVAEPRSCNGENIHTWVVSTFFDTF